LWDRNKKFKTKETIEKELNEVKNEILEQRARDKIERKRRFTTMDPKMVEKFKSSLLYFIFIINFVWMLSLQMDIGEVLSWLIYPLL